MRSVEHDSFKFWRDKMKQQLLSSGWMLTIPEDNVYHIGPDSGDHPGQRVFLPSGEQADAGSVLAGQ